MCLAFRYERDLVVEKNYEDAIKWYKEWLNKAILGVQEKPIEIYKNGEIVEKNCIFENRFSDFGKEYQNDKNFNDDNQKSAHNASMSKQWRQIWRRNKVNRTTEAFQDTE